MTIGKMFYEEFDDLFWATKAVVDWWMENQSCSHFDRLYSLEYALTRQRMDDDCVIAFGSALGTYIINWFHNKSKQRELFFSTDTVPSLINSDMEEATRALREKGLIQEYSLPLGAWTCIERTDRGTLLVCGNIGPLPDELLKESAEPESAAVLKKNLTKKVLGSPTKRTSDPPQFPDVVALTDLQGLSNDVLRAMVVDSLDYLEEMIANRLTDSGDGSSEDDGDDDED